MPDTYVGVLSSYSLYQSPPDETGLDIRMQHYLNLYNELRGIETDDVVRKHRSERGCTAGQDGSVDRAPITEYLECKYTPGCLQHPV